MVDVQRPGGCARTDMVWQEALVADAYHAFRTGIPFADVHFDVMNRLLAAAGIQVVTLLDLGAGDGIVTDVISRRYPLTSAVLVDFSTPMLEAARDRLSSRQSTINASFVAGDFREDEWHGYVASAGPYDAVISRFAIHHIPDAMKRDLYAAILGWLRPGGMFINIEHVSSGSEMYSTANDQLMIDGMANTRADLMDIEAVTASYHARQDADANILAPVHEQLAWLLDAGYVDVDCAFKAFELAVFAGRRPVSSSIRPIQTDFL